MSPRSFPFALLATGFFVAAPVAAQDVLREHREALAPVLSAWEELATWAGRGQLQASRHEMLEALLHFDPEHKEARRILGYRKQKDGTWNRSGARRPPKDRNTELLAEFEERRRAILEPFVSATLRRLETPDGRRADWRQAMLQDLAALAPDEPRVRQALGEVQVGGEWLLAESALARTRRGTLRARAKEILEAIDEPAKAELPALAEELGLGLSACVAVDGLRVLATQETDAQQVARVAAAGVRFFNHAFGQNARLANGVSIWVIPNGRQQAFLEKHPSVPKDQVAFLAKLTATWAGFADLGVWCELAEEVRDATCRQCVDQLFGYAFGLSAEQGWLVEGMGFLLCPPITGTRITWFVVRTKYAGKALPLRDKLMQAKTDWYEEAARLIAEKDRLDLHGLLARPLNALTDEDILLAFLVAAYVVEGHSPETASTLLRAMAKAKHHAEAFQAVLGLDLPTLERRLRRFAREAIAEGN